MNPAVLNNRTLLSTIDGYQVWYFERATRKTLRPYLVIAPEGHHFWYGWQIEDPFCLASPILMLVRNHATLAYPTL